MTSPLAPRPVAPVARKAAKPKIGGAPDSILARTLAAQGEAEAAKKEAEDNQNIFGKGLGIVLNNPVSRTLLRPLDVLDVPRRAVWSTINEVADAFNGGDASFSDWYDQTNPLHSITQHGDTSFGAGDVVGEIDTPFSDSIDKWINRGVGFAGDVALDPLTYVGGLGFIGEAGDASGKLARVVNIAEGADKLRDAGKLTDDALEMLQRVGQRGYHEADDALLEAMGVSGGIHLKVPFTKGPGKQILPGVSDATSRARASIGDVVDRLGGGGLRARMAEKTAPKELAGAYARILRGEGPDSLPVALETVSTEMTKRTAQNAMAGKYKKTIDRLVKDARKLTDEDKRLAIEALETPGAKLEGYAGRVRRVLDDMHADAKDAGLSIEKLDDYAPHILTRDAMQWLRSSGDDLDVQKLRGLVTEDLFAPAGVSMHRKFRPGETIELGGETISLNKGSIEELNTAYKKATGKEFNFYETDPGEILQKYVNMLSSDTGIAAAAKQRAGVLAGEGGAFRPGSLFYEQPKFQATKNTGKTPVGNAVPVMGTANAPTGPISKEAAALLPNEGDAVSNLPDQMLRGGSQVVEDLPAGAQGPLPGGRSDLSVLSERAGVELPPEIYQVTKNAEASKTANEKIIASLKTERDRLSGESQKMHDEVTTALDQLPVKPTERLNAWNTVASKLSARRKALLAETDKMVRIEGGKWGRKADEPLRQLQAERAGRLEQLGVQEAQVADWEQQITNIESGMAMYDQTIEDILKDVDVMDAAADRAGPRQLRETVKQLQKEREELRTRLNKVVESQLNLPRPWKDDPELLARQGKLSTKDITEDIRVQERTHEVNAGVDAAEREVQRLKAARAEHITKPREVAEAERHLATSPNVERQAKHAEVLERERVGKAAQIKYDKAKAKAQRQLGGGTDEFISKNLIEEPAEIAARPTAQEVAEAQKFMRLDASKRVTKSRQIVEAYNNAPPSHALKTVNGRIKKAEERLAEARRVAKEAADSDPVLADARQRLDDAGRAARGPSAEGMTRASDTAAERTLFDTQAMSNAARTPNIAPQRGVSGVNVVGGASKPVPLTEVGDFSGPGREVAGLPARMRNDVLPSAANEVAEATRKHIEKVTDPGEAVNVSRGLQGGRQEAKAIIARDENIAYEAVPRINEINQSLTKIFGKDPELRDSMKELFTASYKTGAQGEARETAANALDNLMGQAMTQRRYRDAGEEIRTLRDKIRAAQNDVPEPYLPNTPEAIAQHQAQWAAKDTTGPYVRPQRTLADIDPDIAVERQKLIDAVQQRGEVENLAARAKEGATRQQPAVRAANKARTEGLAQAETLKTPALRTEAGGLGVLLDQVAVNAKDDLDDATASLLSNAIDTAKKLDGHDVDELGVDKLIAEGRSGRLARVINLELNESWSIMEESLLGGDILIHDDLRKAFQRVRDSQFDKDFWPVIEGFTNFFKTYATLSPGFHVRNAMSAGFMNTSDGVALRDQKRGLDIMWSFGRASKEGKVDEWMAKQGGIILNEKTGLTVKDAMDATFGSGIGGRYREAGVADRSTTRGAFTEWAFSNKVTRGSQEAGSFVEGAARVPVAIDTLRKGGSVNQAVARINRLHFDYSMVSELDTTMKKIIPFWTFMSRNLPLQITQMWTRPRAYATYNSFVRNMSGEHPEGEPDYFGQVGAFPLGDTKLAGLPLFLQPDLPHTRVNEDISRMEQALSGDPLQMLTDVNPLFTVPAEFMTKKDFYTGRSFKDTDLRKTGGLEAPIGAVAQMLGLGKETPSGDFATEERFINAMRGLIPIYDRSLRLAPGITTGGYSEDAKDRRLESYARFLGIPIRQLSPQQQQSALRGEKFDRMDERTMQRALAQLDRAG